MLVFFSYSRPIQCYIINLEYTTTRFTKTEKHNQSTSDLNAILKNKAQNITSGYKVF